MRWEGPDGFLLPLASSRAGFFFVFVTLICLTFTWDSPERMQREWRRAGGDPLYWSLLLLFTTSRKGSPSVYFSVPLHRVLILDRKSTRLNSSHVAISYAVFCLKKKILYNKATL